MVPFDQDLQRRETKLRIWVGIVRSMSRKSFIKCCICGQNVPSGIDLVVHLKQVHNKKENREGNIYSCVACGYLRVNETIAHTHVSTEHKLYGSYAIEHSKNKTVQDEIADRVKRHRFKEDIQCLYGQSKYSIYPKEASRQRTNEGRANCY